GATKTDENAWPVAVSFARCGVNPGHGPGESPCRSQPAGKSPPARTLRPATAWSRGRIASFGSDFLGTIAVAEAPGGSLTVSPTQPPGALDGAEHGRWLSRALALNDDVLSTGSRAEKLPVASVVTEPSSVWVSSPDDELRSMVTPTCGAPAAMSCPLTIAAWVFGSYRACSVKLSGVGSSARTSTVRDGSAAVEPDSGGLTNALHVYVPGVVGAVTTSSTNMLMNTSAAPAGSPVSGCSGQKRNVYALPLAPSTTIESGICCPSTASDA